MSDLFHEAVPDEFIDRVFATMNLARRHQFQILTKRPERMAGYSHHHTVPRNVWLGTSCEDQETFEERVDLLCDARASVRFLSLEPLLGPIDLRRSGLGSYVSWAILGGESGPGARSCDVAWVRSLIDQCRDAGIACFVKQLGSKPTTDHRTRPEGESHYWTTILRDPKGASIREWPRDLRVREYPRRPR